MNSQEPRFFILKEQHPNTIVNMMYLRQDLPCFFSGKLSEEGLVDLNLFEHHEHPAGSRIVTYYSHDKATQDTLILKVEHDLLTNELKKKLLFRTIAEPRQPVEVKNGMTVKIDSVSNKVVCSIGGPDGCSKYVDLVDRDSLSEIPSRRLFSNRSDMGEEEWVSVRKNFEEYSGYFIKDMGILYDLGIKELVLEVELFWD